MYFEEKSSPAAPPKSTFFELARLLSEDLTRRLRKVVGYFQPMRPGGTRLLRWCVES
jgi:hypothetical protein